MKTRLPRNARIDATYAGTHTVKVPLWPYLVTPVSAVGLWAGSAGGHLLWSDQPGWPAAGITVAGAALTGLVWRAAAARGIVRRWTTTLVTGGASFWALGSMLAGPWERPWLDMWLLGGVTASVAMASLRLLAAARGEDVEPAGGGLFDAVKSLKDARISRPRVDGARASVDVELADGGTMKELANERDTIASVLDVGPNAVRVVPNPDSVKRGRITAVPVDQLRTIKPWPGLTAPGGSMADPIDLGITEDGDPLLLHLPGDHDAERVSTHVLVVGTSGAGKTEFLLMLAAETLSRRDAELHMADPRKGAQLPEWVRTGAARLASTPTEVTDLMADMVGDIARRAGQIGGHGHKQWTAGCDRCPPYRVTIIDEAAGAMDSVIVDLTESARSAGISLVLGLQRATFDRFPTSARANIGAVFCFGVKRPEDAEAALSEATIDAGAAPWSWGNTRPGYLYAEIPDVEPERWSMPCRAYFAGEDARTAAVAPFLPGGTPAPAREEKPVHDDDQADEQPAERNQAYDADAPPDDVDPSQPITVPAGLPRIAFGALREPPMGTQEARDFLRQYLADAADAGMERIRPADLTDVISATGKGSSWLRKELDRLSEPGPDQLLVKTDRGVWRIRVPEPA
ncbi:conjugal transfer protein TraB [Solwaraspora sp. WMMD792]|uniref:conjugal transfer protein TraB n=1 Tax=Solwaraspora sp. WMMD792 TaxID=3016099 RepID=UPI0024179A02|nr:conjugal transfer protein TraB [Solwaraspora sp. WMMD792]MDG4770688.1 conjugal transfer protein TraB [Solwaraspora sp. WMMD792]